MRSCVCLCVCDPEFTLLHHQMSLDIKLDSPVSKPTVCVCASSDVISQSKNEVFIATATKKNTRKMTKKDISPVCHDVVGETKIHWIK